MAVGQLPRGYAQYLRPFSVRAGWLGPPVRVSRRFGSRHVWAGDTIGLSVLPGDRPAVQVSWSSAIGGPDSQIYTAAVTDLPRD